MRVKVRPRQRHAAPLASIGTKRYRRVLLEAKRHDFLVLGDPGAARSTLETIHVESFLMSRQKRSRLPLQ